MILADGVVHKQTNTKALVLTEPMRLQIETIVDEWNIALVGRSARNIWNGQIDNNGWLHIDCDLPDSMSCFEAIQAQDEIRRVTGLTVHLSDPEVDWRGFAKNDARRRTRFVVKADAIAVAAQALIGDVRARYPGEDLRCPHMIALDKALKGEPA